MIALVIANHGLIYKFLGDGFMACFGAPLSDGRDTQNAVRAAVEIAGAVEKMNASGIIATTRIGIGLHAGGGGTLSSGGIGGRCWARTSDPRRVKPMLFQLS